MAHNLRLILILAFLCLVSIIVSSCKTSSNCDAYGIHWENPRVDSLAVLKSGKVYLPYVPVIGAKDFYLNTTERGDFTVLLKSGNELIEAKELTVR